MKVISITIIGIFSLFVNGSDGSIHYDLSEAPFLFYKFVRTYNREYKNSEELLEHFAAFVHSLRVINKANLANPSGRYDINANSDNTPEETKNILASHSRRPVGGRRNPLPQVRYYILGLEKKRINVNKYFSSK